MKIILMLAGFYLTSCVRGQRPRAPLNYVPPRRPYNYMPGPPQQQNQNLPAPQFAPAPQPQQNQYIPPQAQQFAPAPQPQQNQYIPPPAQQFAPAQQSQKNQYIIPSQTYQNPGNNPAATNQQELSNQEQAVMDGVDGVAEEIVEAVVNRLEAAEAMAVEMEMQGIDPDDHSSDDRVSSKDPIHQYSLKMYIMSVVIIIVLYGVLLQ